MLICIKLVLRYAVFCTYFPDSVSFARTTFPPAPAPKVRITSYLSMCSDEELESLDYIEHI